MKNNLKLVSIFMLSGSLFCCSNDDENSINSLSLDDYIIEVTEQVSSDLLLTILANNATSPVYSIESQTPANAISIDNDGDIVIQDASVFDFEKYNQIVANIKVVDGNQEDTAQVIINIIDVAGPSDGLIAYYPFEGNPNDMSLNSNNGTIIGDVQSSSNRFNKPNSSYTFSGGRIEIPSFGNGMTSYTISAWIKIENQPSNITLKTIMAKQLSDASDTDFIFRVSDINKLMFNTNSDSGSESIVEGQWYHVLVMNDNGFPSLFLNGTVQDTFTDAAVWDNANANIIIGGASANNQLETLYGEIDDILIYNRTMTEAEIQSLVNNNY